jgi:tetratricopeptide (TPR) repeat protein
MRRSLNPTLLCLIILVFSFVLAEGSSIRSAKRDIARLRYEEAESQLVDIARSADGEEKQEALYLLAGLKNSVSEAQIIYQEVIRIDRLSEWGERSQLELAKIQYAIGDYGQALDILEESTACRQFEEACYFQGLAAIMLKRYDEARGTLVRVRGGAYRPWAYLALAEIDMNSENRDEACRKYRSMARTGISPTAMYRYAECLEKQGDTEEATVVFQDIVNDFRSTPEAVLARGKLEVLTRATARPVLEPLQDIEQTPLTSGFTLQFGAFHDRANAIKLVAELKAGLPGVRIDSDLLDYREVHRVRFGYFASRAEAQQKADELRRHIDEPFTIMTLP